MAGNVSVRVKWGTVKLSGLGSTIRFPNTYAIVLILPLHVRTKMSLSLKPQIGPG